MFYSPTDRLIYTPPIGPALDPLVIHRRLVLDSGCRVNEWIDSIRSDDMLVRANAEEKLVALTRSVFGLKPFSEPDGVTDSQVLAVLEDYLRFVEGKE